MEGSVVYESRVCSYQSRQALQAEHKELQDRCAALEGELKSQVRSSREEAKALQDELSNVKVLPH